MFFGFAFRNNLCDYPCSFVRYDIVLSLRSSKGSLVCPQPIIIIIPSVPPIHQQIVWTEAERRVVQVVVVDGFLLERRVGGQEINNTEALTEDLSSQHHNSQVVVIYSPGLTMLPKGSWHHIIRILSLSLSFSHTQKPFPVHHHLVYAQKDYL